jgi:hypothetical protein
LLLIRAALSMERTSKLAILRHAYWTQSELTPIHKGGMFYKPLTYT